MAVIPEILLQRVIINGYRKLRNDPRLLDSLFKNLPQDQQEAVKDFVLNVPVNFSVNFPRGDLKVPSLILVLKNESENIPFIGDSMQGNDPQEHLIDTLGSHGASTSDTSGLTSLLLEDLVVKSSDGNSVTFAPSEEDRMLELIENPVPCMLAHVVSGRGKGQVHLVTRIRQDGLDISGTFDPYLDSTSRIDLRRVHDDEAQTLGEPSRVFDAGNRSNLRTKGAEYEVNYYLHVIAGQQEEVIYLYSVIKALLISQRSMLEGQGIIALRISGSDFAPRTEYLPSEVFQRMMTLTFTYPFSFTEEIDVPDKLAVNLQPVDANTQESCEIQLGVTIEL